MTGGKSGLANQPPDATLEKVRLLEPDHRCWTCRDGRPLRETKKRGGEDKRPGSLGGNIVCLYLRLVGHVIGQSSQRGDPEERTRENAKE